MTCAHMYISLLILVILSCALLPNGVVSKSRVRIKKSGHKKVSCDFRWSAWSDFSPCSRSCGLGIKSRHRTCYEYGPDPRPVNGKNCKGKTRDHQACNAQACPPGSRDFRELQCSFFKGQKYQGRTYHWKVFSQGSKPRSSSDPCVLTCTGDDYSGPVIKFVDGTQCGDSSHSVCVSGICVPIGCDSRPYSNKSVDRCGVCGGNNSTCVTITRRISHRIPTGYTELLRIPAGSRYVKVTERPRSHVILSLKNAQGTSSIKGQSSGGHKTDTKLMAGTVMYYYHPRIGLENIRAEGPLNETLIIKGYARSPSVVSLWYEYTVARTPIQSQVRTQDSLSTDPSYPWRSLIYRQVLSGRGLSAPNPPMKKAPDLSHMTSTVQPSCHRHTHSKPRKEHHGSTRHRKRTGTRGHFERFQILKVRAPIHGSGRRKSSYSRSKQSGSRQTSSKHKPQFSPRKNIIYVRSRSSGNDSISRGQSKVNEPSKTIPKKAFDRKGKPRAPIHKSVQTNTKSANITQRSRSVTRRTETIAPVRKPLHNGRKSIPPMSSARNSGIPVKVSQSRTDNVTTGHNLPSVRNSGIPVKVSQSRTDNVTTGHNLPSVRNSGIPVNVSQSRTDNVTTGHNLPSVRNSGIPVKVSQSRTDNVTTGHNLPPVQNSGIPVKVSQSRTDNVTTGHNLPSEKRFILNVRTTFSPPQRPQVPVGLNKSESGRKPVEESMPTFMPNEHEGKSIEDLSMHRGRDSEAVKEEDESPDLQVDLSIQVAARKSKKAEKRRRGRDRGRKRKKDERVNKRRFRWQANPVSPCTATCEVGTTVTLFSCYQHSGERVDDKFCDAESKPPPTHHSCATKTCRPRWVAGLWSECSESCGEGRQQRTARCWQMMAPGFDSTVRDFTCNPDEKPQTIRICHKLRSCIPQWEMSSWEECSTECGYGIQLRHVRCSAESEAVCSARKRPPEKRPCRNKPCINQWYTLPWSSCSGMCGIRKRKVYCRDSQGRVVDDRKCDFNSKPLTVHACGRCKNKWVPQEWGECSATCGGGVTTRRVVCGTTRGGKFHIRPDSFCVKEVRPPTTTTCRTVPCGATWYATEWTECSESCGAGGQRYRDVRCYGATDTEVCDVKNRPEERVNCELPPCETRQVCEDDGETRCDLVVSAKLCSHKYYRKACCKTCSPYT